MLSCRLLLLLPLQLPAGGVSALPTNFLVSRLLEQNVITGEVSSSRDATTVGSGIRGVSLAEHRVKTDRPGMMLLEVADIPQYGSLWC